MNIKHELYKDSFIYGKKRKQTSKSILIAVVSIFSALIVALLFATMMGFDPFYVLVRLFSVGFQNSIILFSNIGIFCFAGFAFAFASRAGLFNIGISGQMLAAGTAIVLMTKALAPDGISTIPTGAGQILILLVGMLVGGLIAALIGTLEATLRVNSVVSAILLNWIIYFLSFFLLATYARDGQPTDLLTNSAPIPNEFRLWDSAGETGGIWPILILILIFGTGIFVTFKYTVFGHKIKAVGLSPDAAKYAGYNVNLIKIASFAISGAIAGVLACIVYTTKSSPTIDLNIGVDNVPIEGFNGIAIALIGGNNPLGIFIVSFLFGLFQNSIPGIVIPASYINVLLGLLMLGSALSIVIVKYKPWKYIKSFRYDINYYKQSQHFENQFDVLISKYKSIYFHERQKIYDQTLDKMLIIKEEIVRLKQAIKTLQATTGTREQVDELKFKIKEMLEKRSNIVANTHIAWCQTLGNIKEDFWYEKEDLRESWKIVKINMLIEKHFTFEKIIDEKATSIKNQYDTALTKEVSQIKDSHKNQSEEIEHVVFKSNQLRDKHINKMERKQAKALAHPMIRNKVLTTMAYEINNIHDPKNRTKLWERIESLKTYQGGK